MSTLWTPDGEIPIGRDRDERGARTAAGQAAAGQAEPEQSTLEQRAPTQEQLAAEVNAIQERLLETPVEAVIANHALGLFQLAALHLSTRPAHLGESRAAIDAMACLVEGMNGRLGPDEMQLTDALAQIRLAFVQVSSAAGSGAEDGSSPAESG